MIANTKAFKKNRLRELFTISTIVTILSHEFSKNYVFPGELHDFWEFIYVEKGEILITADGIGYLLKAGEMAFHKPNEFHSIKATGQHISNVIVVSFESRSASMQFFNNKILFLDDHEKEILRQILAEGKSAFERLTIEPPVMGMRRKENVLPGTEQIIKLSIELLLIHIYRRRDSISRSERYTLRPQQVIDKKTSEDISYYLQKHLSSSVTLESLSHVFGLSTSKIKKLFKEQTGKSVMEYFIDMKIIEAEELIKKGELNFTQISETSGFKTIHYFSRIFKIKTGMTPSQYARSIR
jgi:AraC-like DNA-binding protein